MCSVRKGVLRYFTKFTGKNLCQSLFFTKVAGPRPATLLKKRLWHRCFPVNFAKFLRIPFLQNTSDGCFWTWRKSLESCYNDIKTWLHLWKKDIGHSEFCSLQAQNLYNTASFFDVASLFDSIRKTPTGKISHLSNSPLESFHPENSHLEYSHPCF